MRLPSLPLLAAGVLLAVGCAGEDNGRPSKASACLPIEPLSDFPDLGGNAPDCSALDGYELFFLNRFEQGETRTGWYTNTDRTAVQDPPPDTDPLPSSDIPGGRCVGFAPGADAPAVCDDPEAAPGSCTGALPADSRAAIHIRTGLMTNNGGVMGHITQKECLPIEQSPACTLHAGPPEVGPCTNTGIPTDISQGPSPPRRGCRAADDTSAWEGVTFWARVAPGSTPTIRLRISDERTDDKACVCNPHTNQNDSSDGCDKFVRAVTLDDTWRAYFVPFAEMQQGGWGLKSPGLDISNLFEIGFEYRHGAWDLWIDDVAYYRRKR